jgi:hypothetical protein
MRLIGCPETSETKNIGSVTFQNGEVFNFLFLILLPEFIFLKQISSRRNVAFCDKGLYVPGATVLSSSAQTHSSTVPRQATLLLTDPFQFFIHCPLVAQPVQSGSITVVMYSADK